jgi:hypothetical protein
VSDGIRTRDNRDHNPGLYQLSYAHHRLRGARAARGREYSDQFRNVRRERGPVARPEGLEPPTVGLEIRCSIQLSYGRPNPSCAAV